MAIRMDAVNWFRFRLLLALVFLESTAQSIQVSPHLRNITDHTSTIADNFASNASSRNDRSLSLTDSTASASERNRRLIPYMAFYLPPDYPINQQYAVQRGNKPSNQPPPTAVESAGPLPPPAHIPVPPSYMHTRVLPHVAATTPIDLDLSYSPHQQRPHPHAYQPSAGEVYHTMTYADQHTADLTAANGKSQPLPHLLPPGPPGPSALAAGPNAPGYKKANRQKQKTVQHFPPTAPPISTQAHSHDVHQHLPERYYQQQQQQQQQNSYASSVDKQSRVNLTPFTQSNTLPGHFIPIIYTPINGDGNSNKNDNSQPSGNALNYDYDAPTIVLADEQAQQPHQHQHQPFKNYHKSEQQQMSAEYSPAPAPQPPPADHITTDHQPQLQQRPQQLSEQVQQYSDTVGTPPPAAAITPRPTTLSTIYHLINEPSKSFTSSIAQKQSLVAPKRGEQPPPPSYRHKHPLPASYFEPYFGVQDNQPPGRHSSSSQQQHQQQQWQQQQQHQQSYSNEDQMTPQQKYVRYLQQRIRYNKQQQKQRTKELDFYAPKQQQYNQPLDLQHAQVLVAVGTGAPSFENAAAPAQLHQPPQMQPSPSPASELQTNNYPQHSPIRHAVYPRPELRVPANHQLTNAAPHSQVLQIPVRALVDAGLDVLKQQQSNGNIAPYRQPAKQQQYKGLSTPKTQYVNYIVDNPQQSLDEEQQREPSSTPGVAAPQAAYIVITTPASPYVNTVAPPKQDSYFSTERPIYVQHSTLRLQPVAHPSHPTRRPSVINSGFTPLPAVSPTPKYFYPSDNPPYIEVLTESPTIKLRPSNKYKSHNDKRPPPPPSAAKYTSTTTVQPQIHFKQHQQQQHQKPHVEIQSIEPSSQYHNHQNAGYAKNNNALQPTLATTDPNQLPDIRTSSLAEILHKLQASNHLPQTLTPENIDNSIKTLVTILSNLKQTQTIVHDPPQHHEAPLAPVDYDYTTGSGEPGPVPVVNTLTPIVPNKHPGPSTGRPGIDYPNFAEIPRTSFDCAEQRYKGFFGDPETKCQVWHYCDLNGGKASFLCPNGTIFSQIALTCDWWFNVKCSTTAQLYVLNERLYKYILPFTPKFPEDYSGPLVDKYLAMKFQEMEEKMRLEKEKAAAAAAAIVPAPALTESHLDVESTTTTTTAHNMTGTQKHVSVNSQVGEQSSERNLLIDDEVDDISQRGSIDTFESSTKASKDAVIPLSLNPIVVSSTSGPDYDELSSEDQRVAPNSRNAETTQTQDVSSSTSTQNAPTEQPSKQFAAVDTHTRETTKITVEKVEVIEIKPDGASGHLSPDMLYNAERNER